ncbi:LuxR family transcriptional regulator, quorum-sensing transcription factor LasR [Pseudomonas mohnii]|jgi:DNA-binding CsgD family transcriptional regulator|uniref:LuxR family transcriptional regulator, quorum-sensing transcription factor LasR n=1 Tax=Pseudomonas mohnii TaxID=395600 RepID=A0ABY0YAG8_9PSED|nr:helix-turn-helix domain-containing protein [Pseudomonas mohnii]SED23148.1 LuxR family transcriptional regulator, quorum-sensing transcription factor LasR [Pseudomonas mohnii]
MSMHQMLDSLAGARGGAQALPVQLTAKETQTLMWCFKGKTSWEIARIQNCSESTVNFHFSNIRRKFAVRSRSAALLKAIEAGAISVGEVEWRGPHEPD